MELAAEEDGFEPGYLGWELASCARVLSTDEQRALASLAGGCVAAMLEGSTRLTLRRSERDPGLPGPEGALERASIAAVVERLGRLSPGDPLAALVGHPGERKPLIVEDGWLYLERMHRLESSFCKHVLERKAYAFVATDDRPVRRAIAAVATSPPALTTEQRRALGEALRAPLTLITGGPGTGKTTTVAALVRAAAWMGIPMSSIAIAAPTGKAAQRLADVVAEDLASRPRDIADEAVRAAGPTPLTLHRLLGWSPSTGRFARHEKDPLPYRLVVVDEASMVDLAMMDRLMRAVGSHARLVLVGDADQLPSIEAGTAFRDLCGGLGAVRLTGSLRVAPETRAASITTTAQALNQGGLAPSLEVRTAVGELTFEGAEHLEVAWSRVGEEFLDVWWRQHIATDETFCQRAARTYRLDAGLFDDDAARDLSSLLHGYSRGRILCATRTTGLPACATAVNQVLLSRLRRALSWRGPGELPPGAPVLVQRNDYARGLFNGDQGLLVRIDFGESGGARLAAVFPRGDRLEAFPLDALTDLAPAFAMTVHKAQGSEFDRIGLVLPELDLPILTRALVYTAMTRARRSAVIIGERRLLEGALARATVRASGVAERLRKAGLR
jgi:exodeoxyribonuclease V alpha subunit